MGERFDIYQRLTVETVHHEDGEVSVEVIGDDRQRHRITFYFDDPTLAVEQCMTLLHWRSEATSLTYVRGPQHGVLIDDAEAFRLAFGEGLVN